MPPPVGKDSSLNDFVNGLPTCKFRRHHSQAVKEIAFLSSQGLSSFSLPPSQGTIVANFLSDSATIPNFLHAQTTLAHPRTLGSSLIHPPVIL